MSSNASAPADLPVESFALLETIGKEVAECAVAIDVAKGRALASILEIGQNLEKAHQLMASDSNDVFRKWVQERCGFTAHTTQFLRELANDLERA